MLEVKKSLVICFALAVSGLFAAPAHGQPTTLEDLLFGGQSIQTGDKLFFDWQLVQNRSKAAADPLLTTVEGVVVSSNDVGLKFRGLVNDSLIATGDEVIDFTFRFKVRSLDDLKPITDVTLELGNFQSQDPTLPVHISEFIFDEGGSLLDSFATNSVSPLRISDTAEFDPREVIVVEKEILFGGGKEFVPEIDPETGLPKIDPETGLEKGEFVDLTSFIGSSQQTFSQTVVPEPSTIALAVSGMVPFALGYLKRRGKAKRQASAM